MKIQDQTSKDRLIKRLRRIEGQLRALQSMVDEERDCREIMQQLSAASSALRSASRQFFKDYATLCLTDLSQENAPDREQLLDEMVRLLDKTP